MNCEYTIVDADSYRKVVKNICVVLPYHCISIFSLTLHVESVILCYGSSLMVASDHCHFIRVFYF